MSEKIHQQLFLWAVCVLSLVVVLLVHTQSNAQAAIGAPPAINTDYFNNRVFFNDAYPCSDYGATRYLKDFSSPDLSNIWGVGVVSNKRTIKITPYSGYYVCPKARPGYRYDSYHYIRLSHAGGERSADHMKNLNNGPASSGRLPSRVNPGHGSAWLSHPQADITLQPGWNTLSVNFQGNTCTSLPSGTCSPIQGIAPSLYRVYYNSIPEADFNGFSCDTGFRGWAFDRDDTNRSIQVHIYITNTVTGERVGYNIPTNILRQDVNDVFNISGRHGFSFNLPGQYKNNVRYRYEVYAINIGHGLSQRKFADDYFRCGTPQQNSFDLRPRRRINVDDARVEFEVTNNGRGESRLSDNGGSRVNMRLTKNGQSIPINPSENDQRRIIGPGITWSYSVNIGSLNPGDVVCAAISVKPVTGITGLAQWLGDNHPSYQSGGAQERHDGSMSENCETVSTAPYFRVYGGDVVVGRGFYEAESCVSNPDAKIQAFTRSVNGRYAGAGSQFAASATNVIEQFLTASMHNPSLSNEVRSPNGLGFGNTGSSSGKDAGAYSGCIQDYFDWVTNTYSGPGKAQAASSIGNVVVGSGDPVILYRDGDVHINGNITFNTATNRDSLEKIPSFILIVRGNITIAPGVTQLDGVYIAQPQNGNPDSGQIDTCVPGPVGCTNQLVVNGAFAANNVKLNRIHGDVASADPNEAGTIQPLPANQTNIAEVFNFTPEILLGLTSLNTGTTPTMGRYDSIVGLPPIL